MMARDVRVVCCAALVVAAAYIALTGALLDTVFATMIAAIAIKGLNKAPPPL